MYECWKTQSSTFSVNKELKKEKKTQTTKMSTLVTVPKWKSSIAISISEYIRICFSNITAVARGELISHFTAHEKRITEEIQKYRNFILFILNYGWSKKDSTIIHPHNHSILISFYNKRKVFLDIEIYSLAYEFQLQYYLFFMGKGSIFIVMKVLY